jgi:EAL domain-containing protein (putative c-di-GMP-specific phosphodiesterase class I)
MNISEESPGPSVVVGQGTQGRVLVVDDEAPIARLLGRVLSANGYDVRMAGDGRSAVDLLSEVAFDAVLSDIDMPRLGGIELLQIVRDRDLDGPVVLMTGHPDLKTAVQAVEHGALQYLVKPIDNAQLSAAIARAVRLNRIAKLKREALVLFGHGGPGVADRFALESSFGRALETLWMAYQPIVAVVDRSIFGYEALLRSDEKALPHPGAILEAAERLGRLADLGQRIRAAACAPIPRASPRSLFFVNVEARDLLDDSLASGTSPLSAFAHRVVLEITERASLDGMKNLRPRLAALRRLGFRLAIDDLGAGYAGLTSFATLEPEFVKLDMSLIRELDKSPTKQTLVRSMASLCRELGMTVIAEGVETALEREALIKAGCDLLQGYLLAKPGRPFPTVVW